MIYKQCLWLPLLFLLGMRMEREGRQAGLSHQRNGGSATFLKYDGNITGQQKIMLDLRFEIDSTIGLRYDCEMKLPSGFSHMVLYYRFDNPNQCILYNYVSRQKTVLSGGGAADNSADVSVVGQELVNGYNCTHLRQVSGKSEVFNYWMSTDLPGFRSFMNVLPAIKADDAMHDINTSVFKWGGLVKVRGGDPGAQLNLDVIQAIADTSFLPSDFEVPSVNKGSK